MRYSGLLGRHSTQFARPRRQRPHETMTIACSLGPGLIDVADGHGAILKFPTAAGRVAQRDWSETALSAPRVKL